MAIPSPSSLSRALVLGGKSYDPTRVGIQPPDQLVSALAQPQQAPAPRQVIAQSPQSELLARALMQSGMQGGDIHSPIELAGRLAQTWSGNAAEERRLKNEEARKADDLAAEQERMKTLAAQIAQGGYSPEALIGTGELDFMKMGAEAKLKAPAQAEYGFTEVDGQLVRTNKATGAADVAFSGANAGAEYRPATAEEKTSFGVTPETPLMIGPDGKPTVLDGAGHQPTEYRELNGRLVAIEDGQARDITPQDMPGAGYRPATAEERAAYGVEAGVPLIIGPDNKPSVLSSGATTVNVGGQERGYDKTVGEGYGKVFLETQDKGRAATRTINSLNAMEQALGDPSFYSGAGVEQVTQLKRWASALGFDPTGVSSTETFNALAKQAALDSMGGSLGTGFSNADRDFITEQVPTLTNTPEGNRQLIAIQRKLKQRELEIAKFARDYAAKNGGRLDAGFDEQLAKWAEENPVFSAASSAPRNSSPPVLQPGQSGTFGGVTITREPD